MKINQLKYIIPLLFVRCSDNSVSNKEIVSKPNTATYHPVLVDTSKFIAGENYYRFVKGSMSSSFINWGNKDFETTIWTPPIDNSVLNDKVSLDWYNDKYIVLKMRTGSDTWYSIFLPLIKDAKELWFFNSLAVDKTSGIIVYPNKKNADTTLIIENIQTGQKQFTGIGWEKCSSAFIQYCIDSISISKKTLYIEWTTPNYIDKPNRKEVKRIKITI